MALVFVRRTFRAVTRMLDGANRLLGHITTRRLPQARDAAWSQRPRDVIGLRSKEH